MPRYESPEEGKVLSEEERQRTVSREVTLRYRSADISTTKTGTYNLVSLRVLHQVHPKSHTQPHTAINYPSKPANKAKRATQ